LERKTILKHAKEYTLLRKMDSGRRKGKKGGQSGDQKKMAGRKGGHLTIGD